jgi:hypothetical protein
MNRAMIMPVGLNQRERLRMPEGSAFLKTMGLPLERRPSIVADFFLKIAKRNLIIRQEGDGKTHSSGKLTIVRADYRGPADFFIRAKTRVRHVRSPW